MRLMLNQPVEFDTLVHGRDMVETLKDGGDLTIATMPRVTVGGRAGAVLAFTVEVDGRMCRAQTVVTVREFVTAARAIAAVHEEDLR